MLSTATAPAQPARRTAPRCVQRATNGLLQLQRQAGNQACVQRELLNRRPVRTERPRHWMPPDARSAVRGHEFDRALQLVAAGWQIDGTGMRIWPLAKGYPASSWYQAVAGVPTWHISEAVIVAAAQAPAAFADLLRMMRGGETILLAARNGVQPGPTMFDGYYAAAFPGRELPATNTGAAVRDAARVLRAFFELAPDEVTPARKAKVRRAAKVALGLICLTRPDLDQATPMSAWPPFRMPMDPYVQMATALVRTAARLPTDVRLDPGLMTAYVAVTQQVMAMQGRVVLGTDKCPRDGVPPVADQRQSDLRPFADQKTLPAPAAAPDPATGVLDVLDTWLR